MAPRNYDMSKRAAAVARTRQRIVDATRELHRFNRTLASEWAYRQVFISNAERAAALPDVRRRVQTTGDVTRASAVNHRSADCHQPDGRVQLDRMARRSSRRAYPGVV
jgi:hypothetical protein